MDVGLIERWGFFQQAMTYKNGVLLLFTVRFWPCEERWVNLMEIRFVFSSLKQLSGCSGVKNRGISGRSASGCSIGDRWVKGIEWY